MAPKLFLGHFGSWTSVICDPPVARQWHFWPRLGVAFLVQTKVMGGKFDENKTKIFLYSNQHVSRSLVFLIRQDNQPMTSWTVLAAFPTTPRRPDHICPKQKQYIYTKQKTLYERIIKVRLYNTLRWTLLRFIKWFWPGLIVGVPAPIFRSPEIKLDSRMTYLLASIGRNILDKN